MQKTALVCNNFAGINRTSAVFSSSVVTASDIQNVELYSTGVNSGVGIRTSKGNVSVCDSIPEGENVINIFESIQGGTTYFFVHTESTTEGKIYLFSPQSGTITQKVSGLSVTGKACAPASSAAARRIIKSFFPVAFIVFLLLSAEEVQSKHVGVERNSYL